MTELLLAVISNEIVRGTFFNPVEQMEWHAILMMVVDGMCEGDDSRHPGSIHGGVFWDSI